MTKDEWIGILIIFGIIFAGFYGSSKNPNGLLTPTNNGYYSNANEQYRIQTELNEAQRQVDELKKKVEEQENSKNRSKYYGKVTLSYIAKSADIKYEYAFIRNNGTTTVPVTGWTLRSDTSGKSIAIPKGVYLYFTNSQNQESDIYLSPNDNLYLMTGYSPINYSFKVNKCSGYLQQFQTFYPSLSYSCPAPRDENLSSIPKITINDACLDYIESFPSCRIQTEALPNTWSYECKKFITEKINYSSCVDTHKTDKDFYSNDWRVYLKRNERMWKDRRETVTLYDNEGKIVSFVSY